MDGPCIMRSSPKVLYYYYYYYCFEPLTFHGEPFQQLHLMFSFSHSTGVITLLQHSIHRLTHSDSGVWLVGHEDASVHCFPVKLKQRGRRTARCFNGEPGYFTHRSVTESTGGPLAAWGWEGFGPDFRGCFSLPWWCSNLVRRELYSSHHNELISGCTFRLVRSIYQDRRL